MKKKNDDDYFILFQGAKLSKREANKAGIGILFGVIGIFLTQFFQLGQTKFVNYIIIFIFAAIGYLWVGNKFFRK